MKVFDNKAGDRIDRIVKRVNSSNADFVKRLLDERRKYIVNPDGGFSTHGLAYRDDGRGNAVVYPTVQSVGTGLHAFPDDMAYDRAVYRGDTLQMSTPDAKYFTENYKDYYPMYFQPDLLPNGTGESAYDVQAPEVRGLVPFMYEPSLDAVVSEEPEVDLFSDEAKARRRLKQAYAESGFRKNAQSKAGAKGLFQIMDITHKDYLGRGKGKKGDIWDEEYNGGIRDWVMGIIPRDLQEFWSEDDSDRNKLAKLYAAYNWGAGNLRRYLRKKRDAGVDISNPDNWVEGLNPETKRYVKYLAFDEDIEDSPYTNEKFEESARKNGYMASGGPIHINPKNRGKFNALLKRTGKSASWFKAHGTPLQKKRATFALNARKWHHGDGGFINTFDFGGPYGVIPLGGDYLEYLQTTPELHGGMLDPSVVTAPLPAKFKGSQETAQRYAEGYLKGSKPVSEAMDKVGQKIFKTVDTAAGLVPGPIGMIDWVGHMGADAANNEWRKVGRDVALATGIGLGLGAAGRGYTYLRNYVDDATNFGEDVFRAMLENTPGKVSTNFAYALPAARAATEVAPAAAKAAYEIENLGGGYILKSLMRGNPLEKQLSKTGTVNVNNVRALANKGSKVEQAVIDKVLSSEEFAGKKSIDYNKFRKAVQDELITYERTPDTRWENYGGESLNWGGSDNDIREWALSKGYYKPAREKMPYDADWSWPSEFVDTRTGKTYTISALEPLYKKEHGVTLNTYTFSSSRIPNGSGKHYDPNTLGHSRTYTRADEPEVLHVMESQSDWAQQSHRGKKAKDIESSIAQVRKDLDRADEIQKDIERMKANLKNGIRPDGTPIEHQYEYRDIEEIIERSETTKNSLISRAKKYDMIAHPERYAQETYLQDNFTSRQIQENLRYAAEKGQKKMRYPTRDTAAKIEGYGKGEAYYDANGNDVTKSGSVTELSKEWKNKYDDIEKRIQDLTNKDEEFGSIAFRRHENDKTVWLTQNTYSDVIDLESQKRNILENHSQLKPGITKKEVYTINGDPKSAEMILQKYDAFPKQYKKLFKGADVRTVTDSKGNTWYEVDVPENYLQQEWAFEDGGSLILPKMMMEKHNPDKLREAIKRLRMKK